MHFLLMNVLDKAILFSLPLSAAVKPAVLGTTYIENHCITVEKLCIKHRQGGSYISNSFQTMFIMMF